VKKDNKDGGFFLVSVIDEVRFSGIKNFSIVAERR